MLSKLTSKIQNYVKSSQILSSNFNSASKNSGKGNTLLRPTGSKTLATNDVKFCEGHKCVNYKRLHNQKITQKPPTVESDSFGISAKTASKKTPKPSSRTSKTDDLYDGDISYHENISQDKVIGGSGGAKMSRKTVSSDDNYTDTVGEHSALST